MSPLQLKVEEISIKTAINLNKLWHSRLPNITKNTVYMNTYVMCFGAIYRNVFFACAIWTDPINRKFNGKKMLELRRMAISNDAPKNTASRILSIMCMLIKKNLPAIWNLISYQDTDVHRGTIYKASGWEKTNLSGKPNWYHPTKKYRNRVALANPIVSDAPKIRWEKQIRPEPEQIIKPIKCEDKQMELFV